ncbi:hypothetical protein HPB50_012199 [Hyalomma asiaticum]|uniref:Uncharacterized protein n=1 Tax=Hyalomma asiaticum TaxID=266040 RepID=A0ACB7SPW0_HYAAI|nr:hypothetical protein HPB50_012199 [Hyalomma asiaticum]
MGMRSVRQNCHVRNFLKCGGGPGGRKYRLPALMTLIGEPQGQRALVMSVDEARKLEQTSRQQSQSATWRAARKDRLTASNFGVAVSREKWTEKGLQNLTTDRDLSRVRAIQYGVSSEAVAVQKYGTTLRTIRHNIQTFHCGLVVDPGCPWLGASPDRVVWDPEEQEPHGIVEIKCPYSMKDLKEPCIRGSCLIKDNNGTYRLNRTHCYYYQALPLQERGNVQSNSFCAEQVLYLEALVGHYRVARLKL